MVKKPRWSMPFLLALVALGCTPQQQGQAVDIANTVEQIAHSICSFAGYTDAQCVERVLAERRMASLRIAADAGSDGTP